MEENAKNKGPQIPKWRYDEIERKVVNLYKENNICKPPIDPFKIIENRGYALVPASTLDEIAQRMVGDRDAFSFYNPETRKFNIIYNDKKSYKRLRFTLAHEIGHIDLGHKGESDLADKEANCYASYALAPSPWIMKYANEGKSNLGRIFWITSKCANNCVRRYNNWSKYAKMHMKDYEEELLRLSKR